jgi:hypothetical protein
MRKLLLMLWLSKKLKKELGKRRSKESLMQRQLRKLKRLLD